MKIALSSLTRFVTMVTVLLATVISSDPAVAAPRPPHPIHRTLQIVNTGDSYSAGNGITPITSVSCNRSARNYGHIISSILHASLRDTSCSNAQTKDYYSAQTYDNRAQLDALTGHDDVVLVSIGGNDADIITNLTQCGLGALVFGCHDQLLASRNKIRGTVRSNLFTLYRQIRKKDPHAEIIGVGYGISAYGYCLNAPFLGNTDNDFNQTIHLLNLEVQQAVTSVGGGYFDTLRYAIPHQLCSRTPWFYGFIKGREDQGFIGHPNSVYHAVIGNKLADYIRRTVRPV